MGDIETALEHTSIGLCLDTGHLLLGGGDPVRALHEWGDRINHVHLKDARQAVVERHRPRGSAGQRDLAAAARSAGSARATWTSTPCWTRLRGNYTGWLVVEQDVLPDPDRMSGRPALDQRANREFLARPRLLMATFKLGLVGRGQDGAKPPEGDRRLRRR